jgi:acyl carrier protein
MKENAMPEQNTTTAMALDPSRLRDILVTDVGIDPDQLSLRPEASLADLGLDSIALVELSVVLRERHGVGLPDYANTMSFDELAGHLHRTP